MKRLLLLIIGAFMALPVFAQNDEPTANWPYIYPDFMEGELEFVRKKPFKGVFNIHLSLGALHYVENGIIKESNTMGVIKLTIGDEVYRNVGGKMLKVMAETEEGYVVQESRGNYSAIVRENGSYGSTALNSTTTKTYLYNENVINPYTGYLLTDVYKDLHAMKNNSETLPVNKNLFLVIGIEQIPANKKSVSSRNGVDKKAFKAFLKSEKIDWDDPQDLVKVLDFINAK